MRKVVLAPDSFKGTLSAPEVCGEMERAIHWVFPDCQVVSIPVADGGEGTVDCFLRALNAERVTVETTGPFYGETVQASYARFGETAVIETASAAGLPLVEGRENPRETTTYGLGRLMEDAISRGCRRLVLGLGGSCTNDCGVGLARALGVRFWDTCGREMVPRGDTLGQIASFDCRPARERLKGINLTAMCDITNPLYGPRGAARVFAPQKGADPATVEELDQNLQAMAERIRRTLGVDVQSIPGAGAAGGLGAGVTAFLGGRLASGINQVLELTRFDEAIRGADLILTGEGRVDSQSLDGKVLSGVARRAAAAGVPVIAVTGTIGNDLDMERARALGVCGVFSINRAAVDFAVSRHHTRENLAFTVENLMAFLRGMEM